MADCGRHCCSIFSIAADPAGFAVDGRTLCAENDQINKLCINTSQGLGSSQNDAQINNSKKQLAERKRNQIRSGLGGGAFCAGYERPADMGRERVGCADQGRWRAWVVKQI